MDGSSQSFPAYDLECFINFLIFFRTIPQAIHLKDESRDHLRLKI